MQDNFAKRILAWSTEQTAQSLETVQPMHESMAGGEMRQDCGMDDNMTEAALSQEQKDMVKRMREQHQKNNKADKDRNRAVMKQLQEDERKGKFRNDPQYDVDSSAQVTASARAVEDVMQDLHMMRNVSIPKAFHDLMKRDPAKKITEGFFYVDGPFFMKDIEALARHGIKVWYVSQGKEGHDFTISYKVA